MSFVRDLQSLYHLTLAPIRGATHEQRLESFYGKQAADYDRVRRCLLHGRQELYDLLPTPAGGVWIELGGGTGANLEFLGDRIHSLGEIHVVDLASSLLDVAQKRVAANRWTNVTLHHADATTFSLMRQADVVTFSYSLTMIPDWYLAIENARRLLKPGGHIGVVDFYVARKHPTPGHKRHGWFTRTFWPAWFSHDNVFPSPDHLPYLEKCFTPVHAHEERARIRWFPVLTTPYYRFVGHV